MHDDFGFVLFLSCLSLFSFHFLSMCFLFNALFSLLCILVFFTPLFRLHVCTTAMFLVLSRCNDTGWYTTGRGSTAPVVYWYYYCSARTILFVFFHQEDVYCTTSKY